MKEAISINSGLLVLQKVPGRASTQLLWAGGLRVCTSAVHTLPSRSLLCGPGLLHAASVAAKPAASTVLPCQVMAALQLNSRRGADARDHVPYRESRLTRLLQVCCTAAAAAAAVAPCMPTLPPCP
jgi:hypothetical protein